MRLKSSTFKLYVRTIPTKTIPTISYRLTIFLKHILLLILLNFRYIIYN